MDATSQYIKNLNLAVEYKYLQTNSPSGVYIIPEFDNIRHMHGIVFLRRGIYRNGIFRFEITLLENYNSKDSFPIVKFSPPIFNPLVNPSTGILDLQAAYPQWDPDTHFLVSVLVFVKKIFYEKSFKEYSLIANPDAKKLLESDAEKYEEIVQRYVQESQNRLYDAPPSPNCPLVFTESKPAHARLKEKILKKFETESALSSPVKVEAGGGSLGLASSQENTNDNSSSSSSSSGGSDVPLNYGIQVKGERIIFTEKTDS